MGSASSNSLRAIFLPEASIFWFFFFIHYQENIHRSLPILDLLPHSSGRGLGICTLKLSR